MQILIEISERFAEEFKDLMDKGATFPFYIDARGATLLPKHHGRLIDADAYRKAYLDSRTFEPMITLDLAPTIIEADERG